MVAETHLENSLQKVGSYVASGLMAAPLGNHNEISKNQTL
jgi:hypothetical protein